MTVEAVNAPAAEIIPDRIFVGNLPYEVTEHDVRNLTPEFDVVSVEIPRKNFFNREMGDFVVQSKGYGFITYTNADDARIAIDSIVGKSIAGREIYAKYALPQNKTKLKDRVNQHHNNGANTRNHHHNNGNSSNNQLQYGKFNPQQFTMMPINPYNTNNTNDNNRGVYYPSNAQPFYPIPQNSGTPVDDDSITLTDSSPSGETTFQPVQFTTPNLKDVQPFFPQMMPPPGVVHLHPYMIGGPPPMANGLQPQYMFVNPYLSKRDDKQRRLANGIPSKSTVFVGNLDRNVTVDILKEFLIETEPIWVKVPRQSYPPHIYRYMRENGEVIQNKGIAFINYANEEAQLKAIELFDGKELKGKKLNVTVAINANDELPSSEDPEEAPAVAANEDEEEEEEDDDTDVEVVLTKSSTAPTSAED